MPDDAELLVLASETALAAGALTLEYYGMEIDVERKADHSPLTEADRSSHREILTRLADGSGDLPIISEEGDHSEFRLRSRWDQLWLVDPLDGTKEFIAGSGDFTVNIALVRGGVPVLGVVYVPAVDVLYAGRAGAGAEMMVSARRGGGGEKRYMLPTESQARDRVTVAASRRHNTPPTDAFIERLRAHFGAVEVIRVGSAVKICRVAEGSADFYPRFGPTMEWDTAAGDAVLRAAGGQVLQAETGEALRYNKADLHNPDFVCLAAGRLLPAGVLRAG